MASPRLGLVLEDKPCLNFHVPGFCLLVCFKQPFCIHVSLLIAHLHVAMDFIWTLFIRTMLLELKNFLAMLLYL